MAGKVERKCLNCGAKVNIKAIECRGCKKSLLFNGCDFEHEWDNSAQYVNLSDELIIRCLQRISQQRKFDAAALGKAVCWQCARVLYSNVTLVEPPKKLAQECAPATAYLRAVDNCQLTFVHPSGRWYACSNCSTKKLPTNIHVGDIFDTHSSLKPVCQWNMIKPEPLAALRNRYEVQQISLCRLFSNPVHEAGMSRYRHMQGEVNAVHKFDRHYYGMFGFLACKDEHIFQHSADPDSSLRIKNALKWLRNHNHHYTSFFANYETLFRFVAPGFVNPALLEDQSFGLEELLQDEAVGMAFPVDSRSFDDYPLIFADRDVAGRQHPRYVEGVQETLQQLVNATYGEEFLEPKMFPHLHPWGYGGYHSSCGLSFTGHVKMRLFDIRGMWAADPVFPFFKYDFMTKQRLRAYAARRVVTVTKLAESLNAGKVRSAAGTGEPYAQYGTEVPRVIPGSRQHWKSFGLDLTAFVSTRGLPDFFVTLSAYDGWPHTQVTLARGWGAKPTDEEVHDLARTLEDRQQVGWQPQVSVLAAEHRFHWLMQILTEKKGGPLGIVEDYCWKKEYQKRGAVHWHMLVWVRPGTDPPDAIMAEVPRGPDTSDQVSAYLRKLVLKMQMHGKCIADRCFKGSYGKVLPKCKYGFPFEVPQLEEELDDECIRYMYVRRHKEDAMVVPYNPELSILWGASHNVQRVSKHGCEQYLAKYISKPEPSCNIELPDNASEPQKYLRTRIIGAIEALEVLMGFHQSQMTRQVIYLPTELVAKQRMLKQKHELKMLGDDCEDIYLATRFDTYLQRPEQLCQLTYPEFFCWWRSATSQEQGKAEVQVGKRKSPTMNTRSTDDFHEYTVATQNKEDGLQLLEESLDTSDTITTVKELESVLISMRHIGVSTAVQEAVLQYYRYNDIALTKVHQRALTEEEVKKSEELIHTAGLDNPQLQQALSSFHWLMETEPRDHLVAVLHRYRAGAMLVDKSGHYWIRRGKMLITRHHFISPVGEDQEKYYEQKYLLTVPLTDKDEVVQKPPASWMELCVKEGLCNTHADALSSLHSAKSRGFSVEALQNLVRLYVEHDFLNDEEAGTFLAELPVMGEHNLEPQAEVTDQVLGDPDSDLGDMVPTRPSFSLPQYLESFTESQRRAFDWISAALNEGKQIQAAIVGPAGTGKSFLLNALIQMMRGRGLVVAKLAPSGVAAHLIGGTTVHSFFPLNIDCQSTLENGTIQVACLRKTDVLVIDEFSMLDFVLFRIAEGLCRKFAKKHSSRHPWGGRHILLLGDPAQLPAVSRKDIFGTALWRNFTVLMLREVKRALDSQLLSLLAKVRLGICDEEVKSVLTTLVKQADIDSIQMDKTVIICSTRAECDELNTKCIAKLVGEEHCYTAIDTDHNGQNLRSADHERIQHCRDRLPDVLTLKLGARVILRRNININSGWVNGTLAVVIGLYPNCVLVQKMADPSQHLPIPRFRQRIEIPGAAYTIMRQQLPLQVAYAVTVHRVQGMTVQRAVVKLNAHFFASGQAYVALSRVRKMEDLTLWEFCPSSIHLLQFYKDLLSWCDAVDAIRPTPATDVVPFPERGDDTSNAPLPTDVTDTDATTGADNAQEHRCGLKRKRRRSKKPIAKRAKVSTGTEGKATVPQQHNKKRKQETTSSAAPPPKRMWKDGNSKIAPSRKLKKTTSTVQKTGPLGTSTSATPPSSSSSDPVIILGSESQNPVGVDRRTPPPEWKVTAARTMSQFAGMPIIDRIQLPDRVKRVRCQAISPHTRDRVMGDGNCLFRAVSKELTGTEDNHRVLRRAVVNYLRWDPGLAVYIYTADRVARDGAEQLIDHYISSEGLEHNGWGSDVEIRLLATILNTDIVVSSRGGRHRSWERYPPYVDSQGRMGPDIELSPYAVYLYHTGNHYDRVVPSLHHH